LGVRYYIDPATGQPHIYGHGVTEEEVEQVLNGRNETYPSRNRSRIVEGQTLEGRYLKVVYLPSQPVYVITAYELTGNELAAFRRRMRRRGRR
jgi:hypothetical protein